MSKRLKRSDCLNRRLYKLRGRKFDETCWSIYAYVKKAEKVGKVMMRKMATSRKSKTH